MPAELIINLDKIGVWDWEDSKPKFVVIPAILGGTLIHCFT
jgi:hypothetical protein